MERNLEHTKVWNGNSQHVAPTSFDNDITGMTRWWQWFIWTEHGHDLAEKLV